MVEPYRLPTAVVLASEGSRDLAKVSIEVSQEDYLSYPIAPASLWRLHTDEEVFPFHQLVEREHTRLIFETYQPEFPLPRVQESFRFCSWWIPVALDAVCDTTLEWKRLRYPDDGDHDHCLLTWTRISELDDNKEGYRSTFGWITVDAYREFIEQDRLRVRSKWRSIERPAQQRHSS